MAEHKVKKRGIIYTIPTDDLFMKLENMEAFIDDYGRLIDKKTHRVLKELKPRVDTGVLRQTENVCQPISIKNKPTMVQYIGDFVRDKMLEATIYYANRASDKMFYEILPDVWKEHIVPTFCQVKEALTVKKIESGITQGEKKTNGKVLSISKKSHQKMSAEVINVEKRKVLYHWLGLLNSLVIFKMRGNWI